jgi:hypothetical protein
VRRPLDAVHQRKVTEDAGRVLVVPELTATVDGCITQDEGQLVRAGRKPMRPLLVVLDQQEPGEAAIDLLPGVTVGMRMVPVGASALDHGVAIPVRRPYRHGIVRMPVHLGRYDETVPVHGGVLTQRVHELDVDGLACLHSERRTRNNAVVRPCGGRAQPAKVYARSGGLKRERLRDGRLRKP